MIRLISENLSQLTLTELARRQAKINAKGDFTQQKGYVDTAWKGRKGSNTGKEAFEEIKGKLISMCVGVEVCNYCESNEATDIEHIYPKSWFPSKTFVWENYLLACGTCNVHYKKAQFAIFYPSGSSTKEEVSSQPLNEDACIINPRVDNPLEYLYLNIKRGVFSVHPNHSRESREYKKADYSCEVLLKLNDRNKLVNARKSAAKYYLDRLNRYVKVSLATDFDELEQAVDPIELVERMEDFIELKNQFKAALINDVKSYAHPTVWKELIRQRDKFPRLTNLFGHAPEALNW